MHSILSLVYREQTSRLMTYRALPVGMIPNLFMNKMNRCTLEVQVEPGDVYGRFRSAIGLSTCSLERTMTLSGMAHMSGSKETVAFGSGFHGWCFNDEVTPSAPCRRALKAVVAIETAVSEIDLFIFLKSISPSCRMSIERLKRSSLPSLAP